MGVNKVIYYGEVLVDMSQVTVTPETLGKGETALDAKGDLITGTHECAETEPKLQSKTVTPTTALQTVNPDSGYDGLSKVTVNAMPTATQATPSISVNSSGLITASATQSAGYVASGTKSATKQLTTQGAQTITPGTSDKTIASGRYLTGTQTIKGDANLVADNIKSGVSIFGVAGSYEGSGGGSGGGSLETCAVTITKPRTVGITVHYTDASVNYVAKQINLATSTTLEVLRNTQLSISGTGLTYSVSGGCTNNISTCFVITSDAAITGTNSGPT